MYEEEKRHRYNNNRRKRVQRLKKIIVPLVFAMIIIPIVLCIILVVKVVLLQNKVDELLEVKNELDNGTYENTVSSDGETSTDNESSEETTTNASTEQTTEEQTTTDNTANKPNPDGKYAYLTFDDGPSVHTLTILDILDSYGVKATFFVNGHTGEAMEERYKAIADRGHALALHTYTHKYDTVYGGLDKFEQEIVSLRNYIYKLTGVDTTLFRFPGGSSNTIVDDIQPYIRWLTENGYSYWDWNSSSGDASSTKATAQEIVENSLIQAKQGVKSIVILMHDTKPKDTTVEALPTLIEELLALGYEIRALDENSEPVQHRKLQ